MISDKKVNQRNSIRLREYDYSDPGGYFITICTQNRLCLFGSIIDGTMELNTLGCTVKNSWIWLANQYEHVELDEYVIMPNHLHGIIVINDKGKGGSANRPYEWCKKASWECYRSI